MESRKDIHDRRLSKLEKHVEFAKGSSKYSSDRFDILIISLATSSLILSIGFAKDVIPNFNPTNLEIKTNSGSTKIIVKASEEIEIITSGDVNVTGSKMTINNDVEITGNLLVGSVDFLTHTHTQGPDSDGDAEVDTGVPI